jgi:hypothetical protein
LQVAACQLAFLPAAKAMLAKVVVVSHRSSSKRTS